jgi:two-component system sensor histidine kinase QseC
MVQGNRWWLEVLLRNLLDNALRYTPAGGRVVVSVDAASRCLRVVDDGPGIPPAQRGQLLTRFARGADVEADGCGLGLSIVVRIVTILGATLDFGAGLARPDGGAGLAVNIRFPPAAAAPLR